MSRFSGPTMMYMQQAPAFEARRRFGGNITTSTADAPPVFTPPDFNSLCEEKKRIVNNLPSHCIHCGAEYPPGSIIEREDSNIMAYCKKKGACGKATDIPLIADDARVGDVNMLSPQEAVELQSQVQIAVPPTMPPQPFDVYAYHGIHRPNELCARCDREYQAHEHQRDCDDNGWVRISNTLIPLPADWPIYDHRTHSWH